MSSGNDLVYHILCSDCCISDFIIVTHYFKDTASLNNTNVQ